MSAGVWVLAVYLPSLITFTLYLRERDRRIRDGRKWAARVQRAQEKAQALRELPLPAP